MEYVLIIGLPIAIGAYGVVRRLMSKSYHRGWTDGFYDALILGDEIDKIDGELVVGVRKDGDVD